LGQMKMGMSEAEGWVGFGIRARRLDLWH